MNDVNPTVYRLCDRPEWVEICRQWDEEAWPRTTPEMVEFFKEHYTEALQQPLNRPHVLVAAVNEIPVGMVSIIENDHPEFLSWGPWLAAVYVTPAERGRKIFKQLYTRAMEHAHEMGLRYLYVHSSHLAFDQFGWTKIQEANDPFLHGERTFIFRYDF